MTTALELRSEVVRNQLAVLKHTIISGYLETGRLLKEIRDNGYYNDYGYSTFSQYIKDGADLDMGERSAYYAVQVVEFAERNGISDEVLQTVGISKIKQIASLPETTDGTTVKELVEQAQTAPLSTINDVVASLKDTDHVIRSIKIARDFYDFTWLDAIERVRRQHGSTVDAYGNVVDITESRAIELIIADWYATPEVVEEVKDPYKKLCNDVHERDSWMCRICDSRNNLHAHHLKFRSHGGEDKEANLLTVCNVCHTKIHNADIVVLQKPGYIGPKGEIDAEYPIYIEKRTA